MSFSVSAQGHLSGITLVADSLQSDDVGTCVVGVLGNLKVDPAAKGQRPSTDDVASVALRFYRR